MFLRIVFGMILLVRLLDEVFMMMIDDCNYCLFLVSFSTHLTAMIVGLVTGYFIHKKLKARAD